MRIPKHHRRDTVYRHRLLCVASTFIVFILPSLYRSYSMAQVFICPPPCGYPVGISSQDRRQCAVSALSICNAVKLQRQQSYHTLDWKCLHRVISTRTKLAPTGILKVNRPREFSLGRTSSVRFLSRLEKCTPSTESMATT